MSYIILSILINTALFLLFRIFPRYKIDSFQAIVANYFVASSLGFVLAGEQLAIAKFTQAPWLWHVVILGMLFVSLFYLISVTTVVWGVSVASVSNKMSIVIPVLFAVFQYHDRLGLFQIAGIILAMFAVWMVSVKPFDSATMQKSLGERLLPVILFLGCGTIDALIGYLEKNYHQNAFILSSAFLFAGLFGVTALLFQIIQNKIVFDKRSFTAGLALGVPNFFSMFFVMKALESSVLPSATFFPVNNMSIVVLGTLVSILFLGEKLSRLNYAGLALSILAIYFIAFY